MNRQRTGGLVIAVAILGCATLLWLSEQRRASSQLRPLPVKDPVSTPASHPVKDEKAGTIVPVSAPIEQRRVPSGASVGNGEGFQASVRSDRQIKPTFVTRDGKIARDIIDRLHLTESEIAKIQTTIDQARERLQKHASDTSRITKSDPAYLKILIPPYEGAPDLYDFINNALSSTLGGQRYSMFMGFDQTQLNEALGYYGAQRSNLTVIRISEANPTYRIVESNTTPAGRGYTTSYDFTSTPPANLIWLTRFNSDIQALTAGKRPSKKS